MLSLDSNCRQIVRMRYLTLIFLLPFVFFAQSKIYRGDRPNQNNLIYQVSEKKITRMTNILWGKEVLFIRNSEVFDDSFNSSVRYTLEGNKIYRGQSNSIFDLLYEIENGKVYQISNSSLKKCIYTFDSGRIYIGDSTSLFDCLFAYELDSELLNNEVLLFLAITPY
jgi:hypothetical protein